MCVRAYAKHISLKIYFNSIFLSLFTKITYVSLIYTVYKMSESINNNLEILNMVPLYNFLQSPKIKI